MEAHRRWDRDAAFAIRGVARKGIPGKDDEEVAVKMLLMQPPEASQNMKKLGDASRGRARSELLTGYRQVARRTLRLRSLLLDPRVDLVVGEEVEVLTKDAAEGEEQEESDQHRHHQHEVRNVAPATPGFCCVAFALLERRTDERV